MRENVLEAIRQCKRAKHEILLKGSYKLFCRKSARLVLGMEAFYDSTS